MVYGTYNYSYGAYKPTYNWGASHCGKAVFKTKNIPTIHMALCGTVAPFWDPGIPIDMS